MAKTYLKFSLIFCLLVLGLSSLVWAQVSPTTGAIRGTVTDPTGAIIPGATVVLTNPAFTIRREVKTESDGSFIFPLIQPMSGYQVVVAVAGFQKKVVKEIVVRVTESTLANVQLVVGNINQEVVVTGEAQPVNTMNAGLGGVLGSQVVTALPLPTRNVFDLLATDAGVGASLTSPAATILQGSEAMFVGGTRDTGNNYVLNGVDANNFEFHTLATGVVPIPNPDAIQEFRTQTNLYDATSGFSGGGSITLLTKSGTSKIHGVAYEFLRNTDLNANDFFFNKAGRQRPIMQQNQFGGSLGGPIPRLKKTFWFVNYEGMRQNNGIAGGGTGYVPVLPAQRDAASLAKAFGLPVSAIDPVAVKFLNAPGAFGGYLWPSGTGAPVGQLGTFTFSTPVHYSGDQVNARIDHEFNALGISNRINGTFFINKGMYLNPGGYNGGIYGEPFQYPLANTSVSLQDLQTIRPNLLNEITVGFTYNARDIESVKQLALGDIGMSRFNSAYVSGAPTLYFGEQNSIMGTGAASAEQLQHNTSTDFRDMVSHIVGKHSLRYGFETRSYQFDFTSSLNSQRGDLVFLNIFADALYGAPPAGVGDLSIRDFLIGAPIEADISSGLREFGFRARDYNLFLQDDFRITHRLTLNLGVRWDHMGSVYEVNNLMSNFDPSLISPQTALTGGQGLAAGFVEAGQNGVSRSTLNDKHLGNFSPRVGFAYDLFGDGKTSIRGGYGMYYFRIAGMQSMQTISNPPFSLGASSIGFLGTKILANPFPTLPQNSQFPIMPQLPRLTSVDSSGIPTFDLPQLYVSEVDRNIRPPYKQEWNLTIQRQLFRNWTVELGYVGSHSLHLTNAQSLNNALLRNANNPAAGGLTTNSSDNRETRVPIVGIASSGVFFETTGASSTYHAGMITVSHQFSKGLFFKAAYTYSKSLDDATSYIGFEPGAGSVGNQFLNSLNKGLSDFDMTHRLVISYVYQLPGPKMGWKGHFFGNWAISGISTYQSGFPGTISQYTNYQSLSGTDGYGLVIPGCQLVASGTLGNNLNSYLNKACVATTPVLTGGTAFGPLSPYEGPGNQMYTITAGGVGQRQGTSTRGAFRNPFQTREDFSISKTFPVSWLGEGGNVEFRTEVFKVFNTPIFSGPSSTAGLSSFGRITSTIDNTGRQIQFALKIHF
jgi:hypothetical protein